MFKTPLRLVEDSKNTSDDINYKNADDGIINWKVERVSFAYPFIINGKICSGYDDPPRMVIVLRNIKTKRQLMEQIVGCYRSLFRNAKKWKLQTFHDINELEISGLEKNRTYNIWNLIISS